MNIAILGGGFAGLSAAYYLRKKGYDVTLFEKDPVLGGLAVGIKSDTWGWYLERAYHHWFTNDDDILGLAREIGFSAVDTYTPVTASLYQVGKDYRIFPVDTPQNFLRFSLLSLPERLRAAAALAFLKVSPFLPLYEQMTSEEFLNTTMGKHAANVLFGELSRKKFGKYAGNIVASFVWARIKKRTQQLAYPSGGFQTFLHAIEKTLADMGVTLRTGYGVEGIERSGGAFVINGTETFDAVVSTLPTPVVAKLTAHIFPSDYIKRLQSIKYLHAVNLILETDTPLLDRTYWLSICVKSFPMMVLVQHTNMISPTHYGGRHLLYIGNYVEGTDPLIKMSAEETLKQVKPYLKKLNASYGEKIHKMYHFKAPFAQPIFDKEFVKNKPDFETPVKNFLIANLDMTYPYDRGTNYAVKLGREVTSFL
jgi:protoporphyrinogen oxidase